MSWEVTADPLRFTEAEEFLRAKVPLTQADYRALTLQAAQNAFTIAGVAQLDLINETLNSLQQAVADGTPFQDWAKTIGAKLEAAWGGPKPWRLELIFRQNVLDSYAAGRFQQQTDPDVIKARPYWLYDSVLDSGTTPLCRAYNGTLLPADDPWWIKRYPPNHFGCRGGVRSLTKRQAETRGISEGGPETLPGRGFATSPTAKWEPDLEKYPSDLREAYQEKRKTPSPQGTPVSQALKTPARGAAKAAYQNALVALDSVHGDGILETIPATTTTRFLNGLFEPNPSTRKIAINPKLALTPELTVLHEIGHWLDHSAFGGQRWASKSDLMADWRKACSESKAIQQVEELLKTPSIEVENTSGEKVRVVIDRSHVRYLLQTQEIWARAYAQYITTRSGDERLVKQLQAVRGNQTNPYRIRQWDDDDFEPIAKAIDAIMEAQGWRL
jgi:SPP1 gp7 family putative phage head morphogenesis protein